LRQREAGDEYPLVGARHDEAGCGHPAQRLANGRAGHAKAQTELALVESLLWRERPANDVIFDGAYDVGNGGPGAGNDGSR